MYIAMNRFKIVPKKEAEFESIWRTRDTHLENVPGFISFHLIKGRSEETHTLYASHTTWQSEENFRAWTKSEEFRKAHKNAGGHGNLYIGHPDFEGFEVIL